MAPPLIALLLFAGVVTVHGEKLLYIPQLTGKSIPGKLTATTFALDTPTCVFTKYPQDTIWLVVSFINATGKVPYRITDIKPYSQFSTNGYYMALSTFGKNFVCPAPVGSLRFVRVGANTTCMRDMSIQDCNGPLPAYTSVRVMFFGRNVSNDVTVRTRWSEVITLQQVRQSSTIDTWPGRRSGGMIVITTILSVLLAILLACLIAAIAVGSKNLCWRKEMNNPQYVLPDDDKLRRYTTHHVQQQFPQHYQQQQIPPRV